MSDAKLANTIARERVDGLALSNSEPQWLKESRLSGWETYLQTPMPTARDEDWRKTEIDSLDLSQFVAVGPIKVPGNVGAKAPGKESSKASSKDSGKISGQSPLLLSCIKALPATAGLFTEDYQSKEQTIVLDPALAAKGVVFLPLAEAVEKHPELVKPYLSARPAAGPIAEAKAKSVVETAAQPVAVAEIGDAHQGEDDKFTLMNRALFTGGYFLSVPKGVTIEAPFLAFINLTGEKSEGHGQAFIERLIVVAGERSELSLMTVFSTSNVSLSGHEAKGAHSQDLTSSTNATFANVFVEVHAGDGAKVNIVELSQFGQNVFAVSRTSAYVGRDASLDYTTASLGAKQIKSVIETIMVARGGHSDIKGIVLGHGSEHVSYNTIQKHASPDTTSNITFRVALKDSASSIYQGIVKVDKVAQRTNAFQSNKNLLLGAEARADSIPRLEILADDVKCSHGATVGPVEKEQLFYLMSRGLSLKEAEELIVIGFFAQVLNTITIQGAADWIGTLAAEKIHQ